MTAPYDETLLKRLGAKRKRLTKALADLDAELSPEIGKACAALVPQLRIMELTGYQSRNTVRTIAREQGVEPPATWSRRGRS